MRVLFNGLQLGAENSGVQYYSKDLFLKLINACDEQFQIDMLSNWRDLSKEVQDRIFAPFQIITKNRIGRIVYEHVFLPGLLKQKGYDLYHSPYYILPYCTRIPCIVTIHDVITLDYPKLCQPESVVYFQSILYRTIKRAHKIVTVSQTVKADILKHFQIPENKVQVVYPGINPIFRKRIDPHTLNKYKIQSPYLLFVGNIEPKKNLVRLIHAFSVVRKKFGISHSLVIAGKKGWKYQEVFESVKRLGLSEYVLFTGYIPECDLPSLYSMADLFVFPSLYEGFGFPPLEAMACETPVLTSNTGALPETTGGYCLMVDPYSIDEIAEGIYLMLTDDQLRRNCVEKGKKWVEQFSWEKAAEGVLKVYKEIASSMQSDKLH